MLQILTIFHLMDLSNQLVSLPLCLFPHASSHTCPHVFPVVRCVWIDVLWKTQWPPQGREHFTQFLCHPLCECEFVCVCVCTLNKRLHMLFFFFFAPLAWRENTLLPQNRVPPLPHSSPFTSI